MTHQLNFSKVLTSRGMLNNVALHISEGRIAKISREPSASKTPHLKGMLIPGFFDIQVNGGGGVLFNSEPNLEGLRRIAEAHLRFGSTSLLPTVITDDLQTMQSASNAVAEALIEGVPNIRGIHFEGPSLSVSKKGVHSEKHIRALCEGELEVLTRKDIGHVMVTIAPETTPIELIKELTEHGVTVMLGHSNATFEQAKKALDAGAQGFTHLFNAMSSWTSREPGMVGAAFADSNAICGLIVDHHHLHPKTSLLAIQIKGADKVALVTDAMAHACADIEQLSFFDTHIERQDNKLTTPDGRLAGSCLTMFDVMHNTRFGLSLSLPEVSQMMSLTPSKLCGLESSFGDIEVGQSADFILLNDHNNLSKIWCQGRLVYSEDGSK